MILCIFFPGDTYLCRLWRLLHPGKVDPTNVTVLAVTDLHGWRKRTGWGGGGGGEKVIAVTLVMIAPMTQLKL